MGESRPSNAPRSRRKKRAAAAAKKPVADAANATKGPKASRPSRKSATVADREKAAPKKKTTAATPAAAKARIKPKPQGGAERDRGGAPRLVPIGNGDSFALITPSGRDRDVCSKPEAIVTIAASALEDDTLTLGDLEGSAILLERTYPAGQALHSDDDEEVPFDAPDDEDGSPFDVLSIEGDDGACTAHQDSSVPAAKSAARQRRSAADRPLPRITIHASCDRPDIAELIAAMGSAPRLSRAEITVENGGMEAALRRFTVQPGPNLLVLDSTLPAGDLLRGLDTLRHVVSNETKLIVIGAVNDIGLFRALMARGVCEYLAPPLQTDELLRAVCTLFANPEAPFAGRTIAVIGARGGAGASTIAHNLAWSIAERLQAGAALLDLDLPFGTAALDFDRDAERSIVNILSEVEYIDDALVDRVATRQTQRLQIFTAPANLERTFHVDPDACEAAIEHVRSSSPFVVLDLPHAWNVWVKRTLQAADEVIIVACPDLASLRNAKNMLDSLSTSRAGPPPIIALSMVGVPRRPEIPSGDFAEALGLSPTATFIFDPMLCNVAANLGKPIGELDPHSKLAAAFDALATTITGRKAVALEAPISDEGPSPVLISEAIRSSLRRAAHVGRERAASLAPAALDIMQRLHLLRRTYGGDIPADEASPSAPTTEQTPEEHCAGNQPLEPLTIAKEGYLTAARKVAQAQAAPKPPQTPSRTSRATARLAIGVAAGIAAPLLIGGVWSIARHEEAAAVPEAGVAASSLDLATQYEDALGLVQSGRRQEGIALLRRAAEGGLPMAQYRLGKLYERGDGVSANLTLARQWVERAAGGGNVRAMHDLGVFFAQGEGAPLDEAAAFRWFRQAAEFGLADSQYNLGVLYQRGRGVGPDASEALFWFLVAASQGDRDAAARTIEIEETLTPSELDLARARARAFRPRAANAAANGAFRGGQTENSGG